MIYILKCFCSEGIDNCDLAVVDITEDRKKALLTYRELFQMAKSRAPELSSMRFWDGTADYYAEYGSIVREGKNGGDKYLLPNEEHLLYEDGAAIQITEQQKLECFEGVTPAHMDLGQLIVSEVGLCWEAVLKHADDCCETSYLTWDVLLPQEGETRQTAPGDQPR